MPKNSFKEISIKSPSDRFRDSLSSIIFGLLVMIGGMILLFWNEGRAIKRLETLDQARAELISPEREAAINPKNEGKLIYLNGLATTQNTLHDHFFNLEFDGIRLSRVVEMYQWSETKSTDTKEDSNGNEVTTTTYSYDKGWSRSVQNSGQFKEQEGHINPGMTIKSEDIFASQVFLGDYQLSESLVSRIDNYKQLPVKEEMIPSIYKEQAKIVQNEIYVGESPTDPQIGDIKIFFSGIEASHVSVIAEQSDNNLSVYFTDTGSIEIIKTGDFTAEELFSAEEKSNSLLSWGLRAAGFVLVWVGVMMIFELIDILVNFVPILGSFFRTGIALIIFTGASVITLLTISIGWIFYRPMLGYSILGVSGLCLIIPFFKKKS